MTLRDKFKTNVSINTDGEAGRFAKQCEIIANEFAIEFSKWCFNVVSSGKHKGIDTTKQLLEIFKKEKGL